MNRRAFREQAPSFFAAGPEFARALGVLSDGAFKVFAHVCLHAERVSGNLVFERAELASRLGKSCSALGRHLRELVRAGVCELQAAPNQHRASALVVCEAYWPYRGEPGPHQAVPEADRQRYVASVREAFLGPRLRPGRRAPGGGLAQPGHTPGHHPARDPARLRPQVAGAAGATRHAPVRNLADFEPLLREVEQEPFPTRYWQHLEFHLQRCEEYWKREPGLAPGRARPNLEQAGAGHEQLPASSALNPPGKERRDDDALPSPTQMGSP